MKLNEGLQRKEEEHKEMMQILMEQKREMEEQKDQLKLQHKNMKELVEANETELQSVEKNMEEKERDNSASALKLKTIITQYKQGLNETVRASEGLMLSTEKLLNNLETVSKNHVH